MIEDPDADVTESTITHSDILYATLMAINMNIATQTLDKMQQAGKEPDQRTLQALLTSSQLPNVLVMASALVLTVRPLLVNSTIDFDEQFELMWNSHPEVQKQLDKKQCKMFFIGALDLEPPKNIIVQ